MFYDRVASAYGGCEAKTHSPKHWHSHPFWVAGAARIKNLRENLVSSRYDGRLLPSKKRVSTLPKWSCDRVVPEVKLHLRVRGLPHADCLVVKLNGHSLVDVSKTGMRLEYPVRAELVTKGRNDFEITLKPTRAGKPVLDDLLLRVRYNERF